MALPIYPQSAMSAVIQGSTQEVYPDNILRSQMSAGPGKVRKRFSSGIRELSFAVLCNNAERAAFETFYFIQDGDTSPFYMLHPTLGNTIFVRFAERPTITSFTFENLIELQLHILP